MGPFLGFVWRLMGLLFPLKKLQEIQLRKALRGEGGTGLSQLSGQVRMDFISAHTAAELAEVWVDQES